MFVSIRAHDRIRYESVHCTMTVQRLSDEVVVVRIAGTDIGEFGDRPLRAMDRFVAEAGDQPISLFIDARAVRGASIDVSSAWAVWLSKHKATLHRVDMLVLARAHLIALTAKFVTRFAQLDGKMTILSREDEFDLALGQALRVAG
jgi:hypothetical protein